MKITAWLTATAALSAFCAALGGLLLHGLYQDAPVHQAAWLGSDLISLIVAPTLWISYLYHRQGMHWATLLWLGSLDYLVYTYAFFLFGASFNRFFTIYVICFGSSFYALILGLIRATKAFPVPLLSPMARKSTAAFLLLIALPLLAVELSQVMTANWHDSTPAFPPLIAALDLTLVIPVALASAMLLLKQHPWGFILAAIVLTNSMFYGANLIIATANIERHGLASLGPMLSFYVFLAAGGGIFLLVLLRISRQPLRPHSL